MLSHPFGVPLIIAIFVLVSDSSDIPPRFPAPPFLVAMLVLTASLALFLAVLTAMIMGETQGLDEGALLALRAAGDSGHIAGPSWLTGLVLALTTLGNDLTLTAFVLLGAAWFLFRGDRRALNMILIVGIGGLLLMLALKFGIGRPRPDLVPRLVDVAAGSFPSGHAMMTMAIFLALAVLVGRGWKSRRARNLAVAGVVTLSIAVGATRMFVGVHYPSDVLAGWLIGLAWAAACWLIDARFARREHGLDG